jgi:hypothetical protein
MLGARAQLVGTRTDLKNQVRGVLKTFGVIVSQSYERAFEAKVRTTISGQPLLQKMIEPLMEVLKSVHEQVAKLEKLFAEYSNGDKICRNLMTIPGVGTITAVAYTAAVDDLHFPGFVAFETQMTTPMESSYRPVEAGEPGSDESSSASWHSTWRRTPSVMISGARPASR